MWTAERRPCEDAARRQSSVSRAESQENQTCGALMLDFLSPELRVIHTQTHTRIHTHIHTHTHTHTHTARSDQSIVKESTLNIHWKDWCWTWSSNTLATWCEEQTLWKDPDAGEDWRQEKGATENEMAGCHDWLNGHEFEQIRGDAEGTGKSGVLQFMGSPISGHNFVREQQYTHTHTHTQTHITDRALLNIPNLRACLAENVTVCFVKDQMIICLQDDLSRTSFCLTQPDRWK